MKRRVRFKVSEELILQALNMPEGSTIIDMQRDNALGLVTYWFFVDHDDFAPVAEAQMVPEVYPMVTVDYDHPEPKRRFDWGLKMETHNGN